MFLGLTVLGLFLTTLHSAKAELIRMQGQPYYVEEAGVRNQYRLQLITKQQQPTEFRIRLEGLPEGAQVIGLNEVITLQPGEETMKTLIVQVPKPAYKGEFRIELKGHITPGDFEIKDNIEFLGPSAYALD
jgi:polyferredoxin